MTNVSSFELIYKPQSPAGDADVVLQGYFLNITNLEEIPLTFRVDFVTSSITDPTRSLSGNTLAFIDSGDQNNIPATLNGGPTAPSFELTPTITVPAGGTAKVAVLPLNPFLMPQGPTDFEARGYVTLRLPPVIGPFMLPIAQLDRPARVLLTPQNRATYFSADGIINDQTQSSLPTGSGGASDEVISEGLVLISFDGLSERLVELEGAPMPDMCDTDMAMMLATLATPDCDLKQLNAELKKAKIGLAVERRKA